MSDPTPAEKHVGERPQNLRFIYTSAPQTTFTRRNIAVNMKEYVKNALPAAPGEYDGAKRLARMLRDVRARENPETYPFTADEIAEAMGTMRWMAETKIVIDEVYSGPGNQD